ncbi:hypothetical protein CWO90_29545 [Bradyrhizobium sp. Leo121]|nr:hypothetical protein CWO90_29545 [Bradyrhizobium sp. Leo121]
MVGGASGNRGWMSYPRVCHGVVMPGLVPGIHGLLNICRKEVSAAKNVDGRDEPGHDASG